jgi:hypothetical protein
VKIGGWGCSLRLLEGRTSFGTLSNTTNNLRGSLGVADSDGKIFPKISSSYSLPCQFSIQEFPKKPWSTGKLPFRTSKYLIFCNSFIWNYIVILGV